MKTRCTHCGTEYQMEEGLLRRAHFRVACGHCHQLFRASRLDDFVADERKDASLDPEMEELLAEMEETLAGLEQLEKPPRRSSSLPASLDTDIPPEMAELRAEEIPGEFLSARPEQERQRSAFLTYLPALLLAMLLLGQLAWLNRDALLARPGVRALAERYCPYLGCALPSSATSSNLRLLDRRFEPLGPQTYRLSLLMRNDAHGSAPPPSIQVTFTDSQQRLIARRTFEAPVYLQKAKSRLSTLEPGDTLELELTLAIPAGQVTGYEIEFLPADA